MAPARDWAALPNDTIYLVFRNLTSFEILWPAQAVCRSWRQAALEPRLWHRIDMRRLPKLVDQNIMEKLTREAVDCSGGRVNEFYAEFFGSNELLTYIADRSTGLRCLSLQCQLAIDGEGLVEFIRRCRMLEELQISNRYFSPETYGDIGKASPELRCFRLIKAFDSSKPKCNKDAQEIANNMPLLRELELFGNQMSNMGLDDILGKCLYLESLDLSGCYNLRLDEGVKAELHARIKNVKLPRALAIQ